MAAAAAAIAAWQSVVGLSREREAETLRREADARWRADEHLKTIQALIVEWSQAYRRDRGRAFEVLMELRAEVHVMTAQEGPLPQCVALANREHSTIMPDDVNGLAEAAWTEVEDAGSACSRVTPSIRRLAHELHAVGVAGVHERLQDRRVLRRRSARRRTPPSRSRARTRGHGDHSRAAPSATIGRAPSRRSRPRTSRS